MSLNKSDRNYIILILIVLISVLSMKVRPIKFRLVLKAINLLFLVYFLYKRDFKLSLFLTLLLFALNQNGIGNSVDFFQNQEEEAEQTVFVPRDDENKCYIRCYQDNNVEMEQCDTLCGDVCKAKCAAGLSEGTPVQECNEMCDAIENFQNNNNDNNDNNEVNIVQTEPVVTTTTQRQPLVSNERGCRIKCLQDENIITDCKMKCNNKCYNTCTETSRTFLECQELCGN